MTDRYTSDPKRPNADIECTNCGIGINTLVDTHYRISEEERPVKQLEKAGAELNFDDFFARGWYVCEGCIQQCVDTGTEQERRCSP